MTIFKKGKEMVETHEENQACCCDCCHCKKIFMVMVIVILAFIAGIMVGNCRQQYYIDMPQFTNPHFVQHKLLHRANNPHNSAPTSTPQTMPSASQMDTNAQLGGYIIEVEQAN